MDVVMPLATTLAIIGLGLAGWRALAGPARGWTNGMFRVTLVSLCVMAFMTFGTWQLSRSRQVQLFGTVVERVDVAAPMVALTFDDGPAPGHTDEILQLLAIQGVSATFFVTGEALEQYPEEGAKIVADGHELGNHSYSHRRMVLMSYGRVKDEIERTDALIRALGYQGRILFRPPYSKRLVALPHYLWTTNRMTILCDIEPESHPDIADDSDLMVAHVLENVQPGSIVLLHVMNDGRAASKHAVSDIIEGLRERGYQFVTVSELLTYAGYLGQ